MIAILHRLVSDYTKAGEAELQAVRILQESFCRCKQVDGDTFRQQFKMLNIQGFDQVKHTESWYQINLVVQVIQYAENTKIPIDSKNLNKALKCISKLRAPLQDRALRSQLFNKVSNRLLMEIPNLNAMEFILLFVTHRKTFLMEIRHQDTSNH